jgi:hypothetical protein
MTTRTRFQLVNAMGHLVAIASGVVLVMSLAFWSITRHNAIEFKLHGPGVADFEFVSLNGRAMFGTFDNSEPPNMRRWRPRHASMADLVVDEDRWFTGDMFGWGFAVPHLLIAAMAAVPLAWWLLVFNERRELQRRIEFRLCLNCGYDIRHAHGRCPECGTACGLVTEPPVSIQLNTRHSAADIPATPPPIFSPR